MWQALKLNNILTSAIITFGFALLAMASYYTFPNAEALGLCGEIKEGSYFQAIENLLVNYDGRYFTNLLHGLNPLAFGWIDGYKLMPIVGFLLFTGSFLFLLLSLSDINLRPGFMYSLLFAVVHFSISPSLVNELYNLIASYVYLYGICLWMVWVGAIKRFFTATNIVWKNVWFFVAALGIIASTGTNEQILTLNLLTIFFISILIFKSHKNLIVEFIPLLIVSLASVLFFVSSPGIRVRAFYVEAPKNPESIFTVIQLSTQHYLYFLGNTFIGKGGVFTALLLFTGLSIKLKMPLPKKDMVYSILFLLFGSYMLTMPYYLAMGGDSGTPNRIFITVVTFIQLVSLGSIIYFASLVNINSFPFKSLKLISILWIAVALIFSNNNYTTIIAEYKSGIYKEYNAIFSNRLSNINTILTAESKWKRICFKNMLDIQTTVYYPVTIKPNRQEAHWNKAYGKYFGLNEVSLCADTINKANTLKTFLYE